MRIGVACVPGPNARYRAIQPMQMMARRGHEIVWPGADGRPDPSRLHRCDVVHVYRLTGPAIRRVLKGLANEGSAIVYDNDDDYTTVPKESPRYKSTGGLLGQKVFAETVRLGRMADAFTTTNERLADKYRRAGVKRVDVIENHLAVDVPRPSSGHGGIVIGWVAGMEHLADVARIDVVGALRRLIAEHDDVRVVSIGVNLGLPERYTHHPVVDFDELPRHIGGWDIGIAPLADIPCNHMRSDIKLKEYAASGVPWLASPLGPYAGLGEAQGGRLVGDDGWFEALERLVTHRRERRKLARRAKAWAKGQTIEAAADRWEEVLIRAAGQAR